MRGAVIDLGTCTFHALVADVDEHGIRKVVFERKRAVRIADDYEEAADAMDDLMKRVAARHADPCRVLATGIFREREDFRQLAQRACKRHDLAVEVIDADEEARLAWTGVSAELAGSHGALAVIDLGASSLQLAFGAESAEMLRGLPLGALALRNQQAQTIRDSVIALAGPAAAMLRTCGTDTIALSSGTARALLSLGRRVGLITDVQRHVGARTFSELARMLAPLSPDAIAELGVSDARCDTITAGATVLATFLELLGKPVVYVARSAMREGTLVDLAQARRSVSRALYRRGEIDRKLAHP